MSETFNDWLSLLELRKEGYRDALLALDDIDIEKGIMEVVFMLELESEETENIVVDRRTVEFDFR